jgi:hypothetical protein
MSRTTSAMAHPAVMIPVTSWSLPSSGGGGDNRVPGSRVCFTPLGYEVLRRRSVLLDRAADPGPDGCMQTAAMMYLIHALGWPTKVQEDDSNADQD